MPGKEDCEVVRLSTLTCRRVKTETTRESKPVWCSVKTVMVYSFCMVDKVMGE